MSAVKFPSRPLEGYETEIISELCGGSPPTKPDGVSNFFRLVVEPVMVNGRLKYLLPRLGHKLVNALEVDPTPGNRAFMSGVHFYAGVFATANLASHIPCTVAVVRRLIGPSSRFWDRESPPHSDDLLLANTVSGRVQKEAGSFCDLMEEARPGLGIEDGLLHLMATIGAGVVHVLAADSIRTSTPDAEDLDSAHPELDGLNNAFDEIMCEFTQKPPAA